MDIEMNNIFISFDVDKGNYRKFINKLRRKLRAILPVRDGLFVFDGTFRGWCQVELKTQGAKVNAKINSRDLFFHGFQNVLGKWWRLKYPDIDNFGRANVFQYSGSYGELRSKAGVGELYQIEMSRNSLIDAIHVLSNFTGDLQDQRVPLSMLRMILMICEPTRFYPIQASVHHFFRHDMPQPCFTFIQTKMLTNWYCISGAYFSEDFSSLSQEFEIISRADVRKKVALGIIRRRDQNVDDWFGGDGLDDGGGRGSRGDGRNTNKKGFDSSSTSSSQKKSGSHVKGKKNSYVASKGKGMEIVGPLQPLDFKVNDEALDTSLHGSTCDMASFGRKLLKYWRTTQMLNHVRGPKQFTFAPELNFQLPVQAIQFHSAWINRWWKNILPPTGALRSFSPGMILNRVDTTRAVTTSASRSPEFNFPITAQDIQFHSAWSSSQLKNPLPPTGAMRLFSPSMILSRIDTTRTVATSDFLSQASQERFMSCPLIQRDMKHPMLPARSENPRSTPRKFFGNLLKWFDFAKQPASSGCMTPGSLIANLSTSFGGSRSSIVPHRSSPARMEEESTKVTECSKI